MNKLYARGDIEARDYLVEKDAIEGELRVFKPLEEHSPALEQLAVFPSNVSLAQRQATQEQRNCLVHHIFEEVWVEAIRS